MFRLDARRTVRYTLCLVVTAIAIWQLVAFFTLDGSSAILLSMASDACRRPREQQQSTPFASSLFRWESFAQSRLTREAAAVAHRIKAKVPPPSHGQTLPTAIVFLSDWKYSVRFDEMVSTWSHFAGGKGGLVMAALDNRTEAYFQRRGIETIRVFPEDFSGDPYIAEAVLHSKVEIPYVFLLKGLRVVMVEMDIFCRANPLLLDTGTADVVVSEHGNSAEVNVGFWVAYPTCPVIDAFRRMRAWATDPQRRNAYCDGAFDQKIMHYAWLGTGALSPRSKSKCRHFSQRDQLFDPRVDSPVALEMISYQRIMHWMEDDHDDDVNDDDNAEGGSRDPDLEAKAWAPNSTDTVCVHLWSSFGSPHAQAQYGYQHSWYPPESEREAKHALARLNELDREEGETV